MKTRDIVILGGVAILAYLVLRKKSPMTVADLKADKPSPTPSVPTAKGSFKVEIASPIAGSEKSKAPVVLEDIKVPVKKPIFIPAENLIPNVYDRGIGQPIDFSASGEKYYNMSGACSENVQQACKCSVASGTNYKLDIPTLP